MMNKANFKLAIRQVWRDARAGDLRLLFIAVVVAVAALSSVGFVSDRVSRGLERDAMHMLGADLLLEADSPIPASFIDHANRLQLNIVRAWQFPSMVATQNAQLLASIKAVEQDYPLRGHLRIALTAGGQDLQTNRSPEVGEIWVDPQILSQTQTRVGDYLKIGDIDLKIARIITYEPDRGPQFVNLAPRVMLRSEDLEKTGLIAPGSRIGYSLLVAGTDTGIAAYRAWLESEIKPGQKLVTVESGRPEVRRSLDRAQQFLALVAMLAVLIAAVAVALAARRFGQRHRHNVAIMRSLGASQSDISTILLTEFVIVGISGGVIGVVLGWGAQMFLVRLLGGFVDTALPLAGFMPAVQGLIAGLWLLLAFSWPPLAALRRVAPWQILRQQTTQLPLQSWFGFFIGFFGFCLLMWWVAHDFKLGIGLALGFVAAVFIFGALGAGALWGLSLLRQRLSGYPVLRFALAGVIRRKSATIAQTSALAIGMMAILLLTIVRTDLLAGWQRTLPADAPNRFLINVQDDQKEAVELQLRAAGLHSLAMSPMVRGRLVARNGQQLSSSDYEDARAKRLIEREFNLSYADALADPGQISSGRPINPKANEVSLELGLAKSLRLNVGDKLEFDVAGQMVVVEVTSLRKVDWDSMRANFFAIMSTQALVDAPRTWMTAFHIESDKAAVLQDLVRTFPNLTIFDVGAIMSQLQTILDKVSLAVQGLFLFSLLAGAVVLAAALSATRDERVREAALLRSFGASRQQLVQAQRLELLIIGALAGLLAATGATLAAWALSYWVFDFDMRFSYWPWLLGVSICMLGAWLAGTLALRGVLQTPPLTILRQS